MPTRISDSPSLPHGLSTSAATFRSSRSAPLTPTAAGSAIRYAAPTRRREGSGSAWSRLFTWSLNPTLRTTTASRSAPAAPSTPRPREGKYAVSACVGPAASEAVFSATSLRSIVASPAGFQNAASPRPSSAAAVCPMATACAPTGKSRNRAPALVGNSWADNRTGGPADRRSAIETIRPPVRQSARPPSEVLRLIDQHDGDVVFHRVDETAGVADELFPRCGAVLEGSLALGAHEDVEQVGREAHTAYPRRLSDGSWRRHRGSTFTCSSRKTCWPSSVSIFARAAWPSALTVRPPCPITIPFWLPRSTYSTARIYTGSAASRNSSISTATL